MVTAAAAVAALRGVAIAGMAAAAWCLAIPAQAAGAGLPARLDCYDDVFVPYFMPSGEQVIGLNVDIMREAASRLGIAIEFHLMPWRRLQVELARTDGDQVNCAFAMSRTPAREIYLEFGKVALQPTDYALFVRADARVGGLDDLYGKVIGARAGFRLPDSVKDGAERLRWRVEEVGTDSANFQKLALQRVDAVLADSFVGSFTLRQLGLRNVRRLAPSLMRFDTYLVFKKGRFAVALAEAFNGALRRMQQDGTIDRFSAAYLNNIPNR